MQLDADVPAPDDQEILYICARLQQKSRMLNDQLCTLKAVTYRAHSCEKNLRIALIMCKDEETACQYLLSEIALKERKLVKFIVRQTITRLNVIIESMDLQWEGCIQHSCAMHHEMDAEFAVPLPEQMDHEAQEATAILGGARGLMTCAEAVGSILSYNGLEAEELAIMEYATRRIAAHCLQQEEQQARATNP